MRRALTALALALLAPAGAQAAPGVARTTTGLPGEPRVAAPAGGALWVLVDRAGERHLVEVAPTGRPTGRDALVATGVPEDFPFLVPSVPRPSLAVTGGSLWTTDPTTQTLVRIRASDATVERLPVDARYVAAGAAGLWVLPAHGAPPPGGAPGLVYPLAQIDPASGAAVRSLPVGPGLGGLGPVELAVTGRRLWASFVSPERYPVAVDVSTGAVTVRPSGFAWQMAARGGALAATRRTTCDVRVSPDAGRPSLRVMLPPRACRPAYVRDVAVGPRGRVWAVFDRGRRPGLLVGRRTVAVGADPVDVVASAGAVWVLDRAGRTLTRVPAGG